VLIAPHSCALAHIAFTTGALFRRSDALRSSGEDGYSAMEIVADRHIFTPMHHESRTERQEHQRQNGYYTLGLSLSKPVSRTTRRVCFTSLLLGRKRKRASA
jgi:hypothetical protein